jgi:hypothetical protein
VSGSFNESDHFCAFMKARQVTPGAKRPVATLATDVLCLADRRTSKRIIEAETRANASEMIAMPRADERLLT